MCLQSLTMSSCCCVCSCSLYALPNNSEEWGTVWLHLQDSFCVHNCPGCTHEVGPMALESSAHRLSRLLEGLGGLKTTLLPESYAPVIAVKEQLTSPRQASKHWISPCQTLVSEQMVFKPHLPLLACLPPCTAQSHCTAGTRWFYSERS